MYEGWLITRWETPVVDVDRLLLVSLIDANRELTLILEESGKADRPRWRVRFRRCPAYRNIDEAYRTDLWRHLDESRQRCGRTFLVQESPRLASWGTVYLHDMIPSVQHYVIATGDDVVEVLSGDEPIWEVAAAASLDEPMPGKSIELRVGEDDRAIEQLYSDLKSKNRLQ
jgi:hypothetical protein